VNKFLNFFSLFGSLSTLLCCALPVTLVSIGMGATFASLTSVFPQVVWLTSHKDILFVVTGILLVLSYWLMRRSETQVCPIDPGQREACQTSKKTSYYIFYFSVVMYMIGLLFSFVIPRIMYGL
jgi:hypothetical protein